MSDAEAVERDLHGSEYRQPVRDYTLWEWRCWQCSRAGLRN
jgi:hypothetical protein